MLLKKLAKLRRTILWCAVFAVSHLAFGVECDFYFNYNTPNTISDYVRIGTTASSVLSHGSVKLDVDYNVEYITNKWTQIESDWTYEYKTNSWNHISVSAVPNTGYHFDGVWYLEVWDFYLCHYRKDLTQLRKDTVEFGYSPYDNDMPITKSQTGHLTSEWRCFLKPTFSPNVYRVSFDLSCEASETTTPNPIDVTYDSPYGELPTPTRPNYTFTGWVRKYYDSDKKEHSDPVTSETVLKTAADHTLTATWTPEIYSITYKMNGGGGLPSSAVKIYTYGEAIELPTPTNRIGYEFNGWCLDEACETEPCFLISETDFGDKIFYAYWEAKPLTVRFDSRGGDTVNPSTMTVYYDSEYGYLPSCARTGYTFLGWYTASTGGDRVESSTKAKSYSSSITLYAQWSVKSFEVSFLDEDQVTQLFESATIPYESHYGSSENPLPTPTRVGYTFSGWYLGETRVYDSTTVKTAADHALVASWLKKRYDMSVSISAGEGKIEPTASGTYDFDASIERTAVPATGYSFDCWDDDATLPAKRSITILDDTDNPNANKYSVSFKPNDYTVSFDIAPIAASVKPSTATTPATLDPTTVTYDSTYGSLPSVSHIEYNFLGWYTDPKGGAKVETTTLFQTAAPVTLYARWEKLTRYAVTLEKGTGVSAIYYMRDGEDSAWSLYENPVSVISKRTLSAYVVAKDGYTAKKHTEASPFTSGEIVADSSFTLTATPNTYTVSFDSNGGSDCSSQSVTMDAAYGELPTPTMVSAKFMGWYLNDSLITADTIFSNATDVTLTAKWELFDPDLTKAADCVGLMLRSEGKPSYTVGGADGDTYVYLELEGTLDNKATFLISDIEGSGKLSFRWRLQNEGFSSSFEAVADLIVTTNNVKSTLRTFENPFNRTHFPATTWRTEEIELKDVTSLSWRVSSNGAPMCEFYLDNVKWVPAGSEKTELEKWAEYFQCEASEEAVAAAFKANCHLTISFDNETGKPIIEVIGLNDAELASKVKIVCCEDLANPTWIEHKPTQHSKCRFYRGTLVL